jgi:hypothetical protein
MSPEDRLLLCAQGAPEDLAHGLEKGRPGQASRLQTNPLPYLVEQLGSSRWEMLKFGIHVCQLSLLFG